MSLASGSRLGPYEIVAPLGAGGMGEVYRARDTRLERTVAIKVLPPHFADDAIRRQRFEREAKVVSSLNHPNICTLHDIGHHDGVDYIVMEFLEGESLAERLERGPLPAQQVMQYGIQLASALDKAHRSGVTHRDLKPGNIILTKSGAKLLDFGLAKADSFASLGKTLTDATPHPLPMTKMGSVIGTVPYMSPEQLDGREADARSDIFSLGAVLYEMVTGKRPFEGKSDFGVASAILHKDPPPISALQPLTPPALERTIRVCLAKDPDERWQSASDLWNELRWISESGSQSGTALAPASGTGAGSQAGGKLQAVSLRGIRRSIPWIATALFAVIAAIAAFIALRAERGHKTMVFRQLNFRREAIFQAAFAGDTIVYSAATSDNTPQIFAVRPDYPEPQPIGPRGLTLLAVSSKGELAVLLDAHYLWYRLFTGTLARMSLSGGAPREIEENVRQADWSPDGSQLAVIREVAGKDRLEYPIGHVLREVSGSMSDLRFSPKGDRIAFFEHPRKLDDRGSVNIVDLSGNGMTLSSGYWSLRGLAWSPERNEILFSASEAGGSYAVYGVTLGGKRRMAYQAPGGVNIQDVARDGRWLATRLDFRYAAMVRTPDMAGDRDLSWLNTSHARALSQDGQTLLFAETALGTNYAVCLRRTDGSPVLRLGEGWPADLSADGKWVLAVIQTVPPKLLIYPTGAGETRLLQRGQIEHYATAKWFRDGKSVLICGNEPGKGTRFYVQELDGTPRAVTPEDTRDGLPSADGKFVLARGPEAKYLIYPVGGGDPQPAPALAAADVVALWNSDAKSALVYRLAEIPNRMMRVDLATGRRTMFKEFAPADRTGLLSLREAFVTDDLRSYAYTAYYQVSSLFVSENKE